jgi:uncharacterized protein (TIGR00296 family)
MVGREEGTRAVHLAREAVEHGLTSAGPIRDIAAQFRTVELPPWFEESRGVFVTLTGPHPGRLRGCVGFPLPHFPLRSAIPRAAWAAASEDPRFPPVTRAEFPRLIVELSVLTLPERLPGGADRAARVVIGRDGLIVESDGASGLLLPQVAVEWGWGPERFLSETCRKAGLPPSTWRSEGTTVRRFQAELFRERTPAGPVEAHVLGPSTE